MAASLSYRPEQYEQPYYLSLFKAADLQGNGSISGGEAVNFFGRSKLPVEVLKNIWMVADQPSTSTLDLKKFAVAVRLIQLTQNGQKGRGQHLETPTGVVLKPVFFAGVSGVTVQVPVPPAQAQPKQQQQQQQQTGGMPATHPPPQQPNRGTAVPRRQSHRAPTPLPPGSQHSSTPQRQQQQQPPSSPPSRALVGMDPYTLTPQERQRYEGLFPTYAKTQEDGSQFVYGAEAVPLFMRSGVDPNHLREIWNMVDRNPVDNRLDKIEFALAMHLIVCVSKKNLPMPPGGTLPNSLQALKAGNSAGAAPNAPALGGAVQPPRQQHPNQMQTQTQMPPPPQAETTIAPPAPNMGMGAGGPPPLGAPGSGAIGGMNISDAFEGMSVADSMPDYSQSAPAAEPPAARTLPPYVQTPAEEPKPPTPQPPQHTYVQQPQSPERAVARPAPAPAPVAASPVKSYEVSDSHLEELNKLKSVLQKLQAENISLKAQLGNMTEEEKEVQQALGQTVTEITALSTDLGQQRKEVLEAKNRLLEFKAELKASRETKGVLTELISEAKQTTEAIESAAETLRDTAEAQSSVAPVPEAENLFDMGFSNPVGYDNPVGAPPPATEHQPYGNPAGYDYPVGAPPPATEHQPYGNPVGYDNQVGAPPPATEHQPYGNPVGYDNQVGAPPPAAENAPMPMPPQQGFTNQGFVNEGFVNEDPVGGIVASGGAAHDGQQQLSLPEPPGGDQQQSMMYSNYMPQGPPQGGGYPAQAPMPPQHTSSPPQHAPMPPQQQQQHSPEFDDSFVMGGSAQAIPLESSRDNDNFSVAARSMASTGGYGYDDDQFEIVENMKKKAKSADGLARDAEAAHRKLAAEADELRTDADRAQANARSLAAANDEKPKKKGRFSGGGKKEKKKKEGIDQAAKDAKLIKTHFMAIQSQALEAQTLASQTRAEADRLRDEAEAAELDMVSAASKQQKQPSPAPAAPPAASGYNNASPKPNYGGMGAAPQQQPTYGQAPQYGMPNGGPQMMPPNGGGYANSNYSNGMGGGNPYGQQQQQQQQQQAYGAPQQMSLPDPSQSAPGVMGSSSGDYGGYDMPSPAAFGQPAAPAAGGDPYASPF